jgi:hypothetical protein
VIQIIDLIGSQERITRRNRASPLRGRPSGDRHCRFAALSSNRVCLMSAAQIHPFEDEQL